MSKQADATALTLPAAYTHLWKRPQLPGQCHRWQWLSFCGNIPSVRLPAAETAPSGPYSPQEWQTATPPSLSVGRPSSYRRWHPQSPQTGWSYLPESYTGNFFRFLWYPYKRSVSYSSPVLKPPLRK